MKTIVKSWQLIALSVMLLFATACDNDKPEQKPQPKPAPKPKPNNTKNIIIETTVKNPDGASGTSYMQLIAELSGSVDNSNAIQIPFAQPIYVYGNDIFVFPSFGPNGIQQVQKYTKTGNELKKVGEMDFPPGAGASNITKVNDQKAYVPMFGVGKVWVINPSTMTKLGEIDFNDHAYGDNVAETGQGIIRDSKYYLPLAQVGANYMPYPEHLQVDVAVIDVTTDKVLKITSETTSQLSFPTRPMLKDMIFMNEQKDIYISCVGFFGYVPKMTQNGFVCIPAGTTEIDASKTWDISNTTIEGTSYKPASVYNSYYIGNGKVVAYVGIIELIGDNPYTARNAMAVLIDLNTKTIKKIEGIPYTDGHSISINKFNNLIAFGAYGKDKVGFFTYNPANGKVEHALTTVGNPGFLHVFK